MQYSERAVVVILILIYDDVKAVSCAESKVKIPPYR